jgi:undecaprenyl-diphosphatase
MGLVFCTMAVGYFVTAFLKELMMLPRPLGSSELLSVSSYAFPSGHTSMATMYFLLIAYIVIRRIVRPTSRSKVIVSALLGVLLVGFSRMYLGVHWFSDVIGGVAVGVLVTSSAVLLFELVLDVIGPHLFRAHSTENKRS